MGRRQRSTGGAHAELRARVAHATARLVVEGGLSDRQRALRKAMQRLGVSGDRATPEPEELERAVADYRRLFGGSAQGDALQARRAAALEALGFFSGFQPRLVGAVLDGSADRHSPVQLQLFSDDPDAVARFLLEQHIPHTSGSRRLLIERDREETFPQHGFVADGIEFELCVLPLALLRQAPLDRRDGKPMQRAGAAALRALLA